MTSADSLKHVKCQHKLYLIAIFDAHTIFHQTNRYVEILIG
jgi:hypothetical protein